MRPINYTTHEPKFTWSNSPTYVFHYTFSQLREFIKEGRKSGAVGQILISHDGKYSKYRGYGTIENPCTRLITINFQHIEEWSGKFNPDEIVNPKPAKWLDNFGLLIPMGKLKDGDAPNFKVKYTR